jgi:miniconductance mechanosensitive channel
LRQHEGIAQNQTLIVRQLQPTNLGIPMEIYAFTDTTVWLEYENIQADIFDHLISILPEFGLRIYQSASQIDMQILATK